MAITDSISKFTDKFNKKNLRIGLVSAAVMAAAAGYMYWDIKQDGYERASNGPAATITPYVVEAERQQAALTQWRQNWQSICFVEGQEQAVRNREAARVQTALQKLGQEELVGKPAVEALAALRTAVCINDSPKALEAAYIDATNILTVGPNQTEGWLMGNALLEARHAVQQRQGMRGSINTTFEENVRIGFALEADAVATTILAAARMNAKGESALWQAISHDPIYADLVHVYHANMNNTKSEAQATRAVFDAWYDGAARLRHSYHDTLQRTQNEKRWPVDRPFFDKLPSNFFERLGELGDGTNYGANQSPRIQKIMRLEG